MIVKAAFVLFFYHLSRRPAFKRKTERVGWKSYEFHQLWMLKDFQPLFLLTESFFGIFLRFDDTVAPCIEFRVLHL